MQFYHFQFQNCYLGSDQECYHMKIFTEPVALRYEIQIHFVATNNTHLLRVD